MAKKKYFKIDLINNKVEEKEIEYIFSPGSAKIQKEKNIKSIKENIEKKEGFENKILEISTKSDTDLGVKLSAFNLSIKTKKNRIISVETLFQSSKKFEKGGPFLDLLDKDSKSAKKDKRLRESGELVCFMYKGEKWELEPKTLFYDWLYINILDINIKEKKLNLKEIKKYQIFTDVEFNHKKSINCQARSLALYIVLHNMEQLKKSLKDKEFFKKNLEKIYGISFREQKIEKEEMKLETKELKIIPPYMIENLKNEQIYKEKLKRTKEILNLVPKNFLDVIENVSKLLERKLSILDNKIPNNIKKNLEYWVEKNWIIVLSLRYVEIQTLFFSKSNDTEKYNLYLIEEVKKNLKNEETNQKVFKSKFFKNNAFKSVLECYKSKNYYAGVMVLATMIDGALIKIQEKKENRRKIGNNVSKEINNKSDESWSLEYILDYSLIIWLEKFFENANDFSNKKLNRNMLLHGMYEKEITELEFFQLLNVVYVMAERLDDWREKIN